MKIPIKYGLLITMGVMAWVLISHSVVSNPKSLVHALGAPVFFNLLHFLMIYLGLKQWERERNETPTFKEGLKKGVAISFVYALTASLFFAGLLAYGGTKWLATEPGMGDQPVSRVAGQAFAALFVRAMILGLIYSTLISFFLARRQSDER
jgi:hypothetical protein